MKFSSTLLFLFSFISGYSSEKMFSGPQVKNADGLQEYTGYTAAGRVNNRWRKKAYLSVREQMAVNYGNNVEYQLWCKQILLTPQTADFLYHKFIPVPKYKQGSRPELEKVVADVTRGLSSCQEQVLAIMRFCRDLKKTAKVTHKNENWKFGGTEEELIAKGEDLCETLGRLFVALCEVKGIPARVVMHNIGGHITAEAYIDGRWGYLDPRFGIYFLKKDGRIASLRELQKDPAITRRQSEQVKSEVAGDYTWEQRAEFCRTKFFRQEEINGFGYYSLADAPQYNYRQIPLADATANGLFRISKIYGALIKQVFWGNPDIDRHFWERKPLKKLRMDWRNDGFSSWYEAPAPYLPEQIDQREIAPFKNSPFESVTWGTGPGSTFTHRTQAGQIFGYEISESEWQSIMRPGDRNVYDSLQYYLKKGLDPQAVAAELGHKNGLKVYSRLEMNHEYSSATPWMWKAFVGDLNKNNPQYRIRNTYLQAMGGKLDKNHPHYDFCFENDNLDFAIKEVRDFKLAILRELARSGVDGIEVDLSVYTPHFAVPDAEIMTAFIRDVRAMINEESRKLGKKLALIVCVPHTDCEMYGIDWQTWLEEKLVDRIIPGYTVRGIDKHAQDLRVEDFVRQARKNNIEVFGFIDQSLRIFSRDPAPDGKQRYSRGKAPEEYRAQALTYMRTGVDGVNFGMAVNNNYRLQKEMFDSLAYPEKIEFADKNYLAKSNSFNLAEINPAASQEPDFTVTQNVSIRVADDIAAARQKKLGVKTAVVLNFRALNPGEKMDVYINGYHAGTFSGDSVEEKNRLDSNVIPTETDLTTPDWWKRGVHTLEFPAEKLWLGENFIRLTYAADAPQTREKLQVLWPEIQIRYQ